MESLTSLDTIQEVRASDIKRFLKAEPFEPISLALSDGRSVLIRHPDQVVVSERYIYVGLARLERSKPLATPKSSDTIAPDFLWLNLLHITTVEPADRGNPKPKRKRRK